MFDGPEWLSWPCVPRQRDAAGGDTAELYVCSVPVLLSYLAVLDTAEVSLWWVYKIENPPLFVK
jgi:hypothetical protein